MDKEVKIALCLIVKGDDKEADMLSQALKNATPHVDGVFVTITQPNKKTERVAKAFGAEVSHYKWDKNFANARNYNFSQVPKEYTHILWMDADDQFRGLENLREELEKNPDTDVFVLNYLYAFDEWKNPIVVHMKTQVVKNNGCVKWIGALHEDFTPTRQITSAFLEDIDRLHLSNEERFEKAKERNVGVAKKDVKANPKDPRSYWNLGNSLKAQGRNEEAIKAFDTFLDLSSSDDEKYMIYIRLAEIYLQMGKLSEALKSARFAIGTRPEFPDAYSMAGSIYAQMNRLEEAKEMYLSCLVKEPPYKKVLVYNPRDYDYNPLMALSKVYFKMNQPKEALTCLESCKKIYPESKELDQYITAMRDELEVVEALEDKLADLREIKDKDKLKEELEKLPENLRQHPSVAFLYNSIFFRTESSGNDLAFFCGYTKEEWTPETAEKYGIGGSEEAVIHLSQKLAEMGWNVTVYNNCGTKARKYGDVEYKPFWTWNPRDKWDALIIWRNLKPLDYDLNADKIFIDLHDVMPEGEFTEERMEKADKIFVKSQAHRRLFPNVSDDKFAIIPNGVDISKFDKKVKRDPYYLVNFSSPDRSLETLLDMIPEIMDRLPKDIKEKTQFGWFYGWQVFDANITSEQGQAWARKVKDKFNELKDKGYIKGGYRINHDAVAEENLRAGALVYPTEFYEIDYIGGTKTQISGAVPIMTDFAALDEKIQYGYKVHSDLDDKEWQDVEWNFGLKDPKKKEEFIEVTVNYLKNADNYDKMREEMSEWAKKKYDWEVISKEWDNVLRSISTNKTRGGKRPSTSNKG